jgi:hypothetical protein
MTFQPDQNLINDHLSWLGNFDARYTKNWEKLLNQDPEAAACEASVRRVLHQNGNSVEPNEKLSGNSKSPDFVCSQAGKKFFVEATCIRIEIASERTGLVHPFDEKAFTKFSGFSPLNEAIYLEAKNKTPQCSNLGEPVLVAVGTFHWQASYLCLDQVHLELLLTGTTSLSHDISQSTGAPIGDSYVSTKLESAAFLRFGNASLMNPALKPVSGILACGFGCNPHLVRCVLHPDPVHKFERSLLPQVEFCRLKSGYDSGKMVAEWF